MVKKTALNVVGNGKFLRGNGVTLLPLSVLIDIGNNSHGARAELCQWWLLLQSFTARCNLKISMQEGYFWILLVYLCLSENPFMFI